MTKITGLGKAIAQLRAETAWSQEALAASAGVSTRTVQRLEEGKPAALETVAAIARALGRSVDNLKKYGTVSCGYSHNAAVASCSNRP